MGYPQTTFARTIVSKDSLIGRRREAVLANTLLYQLDVLKKTGRYDAFRLKWHPVYDEKPLVLPIPNHLFWDSDVAKWIEGACYFLKQSPLPAVESAIKELVDMIRSAQQPDGYLNIHYTVVEPGKRFTNLKDMHELYNAGHLIEAALAHHDCFQNTDLLDPILKYVDLFCKIFGPGDDQTHGYPGHPEIELALLRLYDRTKDPKHLALARYFLTERGNPSGVDGQHYFDWEADRRGDAPSLTPAFYPEPRSLWYHQAHEPISCQKSIEGHSVRAAYLLTAAADLHRIDGAAQDVALRNAVYGLWDNMVDRKMYVTGGIGAIKQWEGFGIEYFLPQGTDDGGCYSETCAAIGVMMWAQRMLETDLDSKFSDIMELCLYNAVLTAMSHDGTAFTYVNQLASSDQDLAKRSEWFTVACCPPNILRLLGQIGGYIWSSQIDEKNSTVAVAVHLFISSALELAADGKKATISQKTVWPWRGRIDFDIEGDMELAMSIRVPGWTSEFKLEPECPDAVLKKGYLSLPAAWLAANKSFSLSIPLTPRWIAPHSLTGQDVVALARGPIIYCVEDADNAWVQDHFKTTYVDPTATIAEKWEKHESSGDELVSLVLKNGSKTLSASPGQAPSPSADYASVRAGLSQAPKLSELHFVPYGLQMNRGGRGHMRVGLRILS